LPSRCNCSNQEVIGVAVGRRPDSDWTGRQMRKRVAGRTL